MRSADRSTVQTIGAREARGGAGDRLARAKSASAAPTLATTVDLIARTGWNFNTVSIHKV
jgi:hypothetical protein